jgi:hypothetical protein
VPGESSPDDRGRRDKDLSGCFNVHIMAEWSRNGNEQARH